MPRSMLPMASGALAFFEMQAVRPMTVTFSFTPEIAAYVAGSFPTTGPLRSGSSRGDSGFYVLHLNFPDHAAALAMPTAHYWGILEPYQERPKKYPLQFVIHFDPATDSGKLYPLLMTTADSEAQASTPALAARLQQQLDSQFRQTFTAIPRSTLSNFAGRHLSIETPDTKPQSSLRLGGSGHRPTSCGNHTFSCRDGVSRGFLRFWRFRAPGLRLVFWPRLAPWMLYAVDSFGDYQLTRDELNFLIKRESRPARLSTNGRRPPVWSIG